MATNEFIGHDIMKACEWAAHWHREQRRKADDTPYINHPIGVAYILARHVLTTFDPDLNYARLMQAAFLHDAVEDTECTLRDVADRFGDSVASIVNEVTDDKTLRKDRRKRDQIRRVADGSMYAKMIKVADKIHNCRDIVRRVPPGWSVEYAQGYFLWSQKVVEAAHDMAPSSLVDEFYRLLRSEFEIDGHRYLCNPFAKQEDADRFLEDVYYPLCAK